MIRKYSLVIEGEPGSYSAHVPELAAVLITGTSVDEVKTRAQEAIRLYWESLPQGSANSQVQEIEVELPA